MEFTNAYGEAEILAERFYEIKWGIYHHVA